MADSVFTVIGRTTRNLVDSKLDLTGGTLTGPLVIPDPTQPNHAASRGYIDNELSSFDLSPYARLDGANFTGGITLRDGNTLGILSNFYGGILIAQTQPVIETNEFDAVASQGSVTITGDSSPFSTTTISLSHGTPSEVTFTLTASSTEGANTTCTLTVDEASKQAYENLTSGGSITIGSSVVGFV